MIWFACNQWVLQKVCFKRSLFCKKLRELLNGLTRVERFWLVRWCQTSLS